MQWQISRRINNGVNGATDTAINPPAEIIIKEADVFFEKCSTVERIKKEFKSNQKFRQDVRFGAFRDFCEK